jgi:hypothetical protein
LVELVGEGAHGDGDRYALDVEEVEPSAVEPFPVETSRGNPRVRQPGQRDVVENIVACEAFGVAVEGARDELQTPRVVVKQIGCELCFAASLSKRWE